MGYYDKERVRGFLHNQDGIIVNDFGEEVILRGWGMGNWRSRQYQQRIKDLQILQLIISCLIGEISYARNTLPEAFSRISEKVASPFREYLQSVAKRLKEQTGETFVRIL